MLEEAATLDEAVPEEAPAGPATDVVSEPLSMYTPENSQSSVAMLLVWFRPRRPTCQSAPLEEALTLIGPAVLVSGAEPYIFSMSKRKDAKYAYCRMVKGDRASTKVDPVRNVVPHASSKRGVPLHLAVDHPTKRIVRRGTLLAVQKTKFHFSEMALEECHLMLKCRTRGIRGRVRYREMVVHLSFVDCR